MAKTASLFAATLTALCLCHSPAHALASRAWVSGHGTDAAGCGAPTNPCRTLQYVVTNIIAPAGEIDVLDPAGYGAVTITKPLSIVNDGAGTAGMQASSGNAVTINVGASDAVVLRGFEIDGLGTGSIGIQFNSGAALTIANCVVQNFTSDGIQIQPSTGTMLLTISQTTAANNGGQGVSIVPRGNASVRGTIAGSEALHNGGAGIYMSGDGTTGLATFIEAANTNVSHNGADGIQGQGAGVTFAITHMFGTNNFDGVGNYNSSTGAATAYTFGDSRFIGNRRSDSNAVFTSVSGQ